MEGGFSQSCLLVLTGCTFL